MTGRKKELKNHKKNKQKDGTKIKTFQNHSINIFIQYFPAEHMNRVH